MEETRWLQPFEHPSGHWKKQLPTKHLKLAEKGRLDEIKQLVAEDETVVNKRGPHGRTLLFEAVRRGRLSTVEWLLGHNADPNLTGCYNSESFVQLSPLAAAAYYRCAKLLPVLKAAGATNDVFRLAFCGDVAAVREAVTNDVTLLNAEDPGDAIYFSPLLSFFVSGNSEQGTQWLVERGADVPTYSFQLLFYAARRGSCKVLNLLFANGATLRSADASMWMASNDLGVLNLLIQHGLSANQRPYHGLSPLSYVCRADKAQRVEKLELLLSLKPNLNHQAAGGRTALHYAVQAKSTAHVKRLLAAGIDRWVQNDDGQTALDLARQKNATEIVEILS